MKVISNIYGEKEWTEIDGLDHLDALKSLVFHHLTDSVSFLKYLTECTMHVRNESKLKWARNVKKKEMNMETIRLDAEITALDTELGCMKDRLNQDLSNSDPMHLIEDEKELHKEFTRKTNIIHTKRDLIVSEFNRQSALLVKLDKEEVVSTCVIHEFEAILKQSSKLLIGVDRNGTIYWWIQINPELYTVLLEHTDESDPLITLPKSHSELLGMTNSMRMTDSMDSLLRKNLIDKFHKIDVDLNVTLKTRPLITDDPASISGLLNDARLKKSFDWLEQCGIKSNVFDTRCYTDLFKHALPPLMFHCNHYLQLITQKLQSNSILPLYDIALLNSFNLPPIILNLLNFFTLFEKRFDFMFQSFFTEYRQLRTIILFSDLCEWIHSLTDALRSHERGMKRIRNSKESINLQVVEEVIFVDPGVRIRKQVTTLVFDSPVAKRRSVSTRYKTKRKMTVIESEEDKDQVDEEGQENKEDGDEQEEEEEEEEEDGEANFSIDSFKENTKESKKRRLRVDKVETTDKEDTLLWRGRSPRRKRGNDAIVIHYESESS